MATNYTPLTNGQGATAANFNAPLQELDDSIEDIRDGSGTLSAPDITSFANAEHDHTDSAGGGLLPFDALDASAETEGHVLVVRDVSGTNKIRAESVGVIPTGGIAPYAGSSAPSGWLLCDGAAVSRTTYAALFAVVSTTYGVGDGSTTFNLPDLRGRVPAGLDNLGGTSANRITFATADTLGGAYGAQTHTLTTSQIPAHTHDLSKLGNSDSGAGGASASGVWGNTDSAPTTSTYYRFRTTSSGGSGGSHNNVQPSLFLSYLIKT